MKTKTESYIVIGLEWNFGVKKKKFYFLYTMNRSTGGRTQHAYISMVRNIVCEGPQWRIRLTATKTG